MSSPSQNTKFCVLLNLNLFDLDCQKNATKLGEQFHSLKLSSLYQWEENMPCQALKCLSHIMIG